MLTRQSNVAPQDEYYADSLLTQPSSARSVFNNLSMGFATPMIALNMLDSQFAQKPEGQAMLSAYKSLQLENETPGMGWTQWLANEGANMIGMGLNPVTWVGGELGALGAKGISLTAARAAPDALSVFMRKPISELLSKPIGQYIPSMVGKEGAEKTLSLGLLSDKTISNFGIFAGAGVPQGIVDNFNADTGHINWGGVAREAGEMGAFGIAIGSIPFAWGIIRGKINRSVGKSPTDVVTPEDLSSALERKQISPAEHAWYSDYLEYQKDPSNEKLGDDLKGRATDLISNSGHKTNSVSNEALFDILSPNDVSNLHGAIADQLAGDVPPEYKMALTDYIIRNRLDYLRRDPRSLDGVRGYVDFINQKLESRYPKTVEADKILDDHLTRGVKENMPFSQKEMFKMMRQAGFEASHVQHIPLTIPENMAKHLKIAEKITKLEQKLRVEKRKGLEPNKQTLRRIDELRESQPKILTPKEELEAIRKSLITEKGLKKGWERSNAYHRLLDLSNVWHNARTLLDRVHLEHQYEKQSAFRDLAHEVLRISDSDLPKLAEPENVMDYMKRRIEGQMFKAEAIPEVEATVEARRQVPTDADTILNEQQEQIKNTKAEDAKEDFVKSTDRFKEFKDSESIFKNLISCVLGGISG